MYSSMLFLANSESTHAELCNVNNTTNPIAWILSNLILLPDCPSANLLARYVAVVNMKNEEARSILANIEDATRDGSSYQFPYKTTVDNAHAIATMITFVTTKQVRTFWNGLL